MKKDFDEDPIKEVETDNKILIKTLIIRVIIVCLICAGFYYIEDSIMEKINEPPEFILDSYINYANGEKIPTLYYCTGYEYGIDSEYRFEDTRFGDKVTTVEISYEAIPQNTLNHYEFFLLTQDYKFLDYFDNEDKLFVKNVKNEESEEYKEYAAFVIIIGNTKIIYGVLEGTYDRIFN